MRAVGRAFTVTAQGTLRMLQTPVDVCPAFNPETLPRAHWPPFSQFSAIWDTGATGSVITQHVVDALGLKATGMTQTHHAGGQSLQETYLVNIRLLNGVGFSSVTVTKAPITGTHMLIGMDIIGA